MPDRVRENDKLTIQYLIQVETSLPRPCFKAARRLVRLPTIGASTQPAYGLRLSQPSSWGFFRHDPSRRVVQSVLGRCRYHTDPAVIGFLPISGTI